MVNSDYSIYQKPKSWISRLSLHARRIVNNKNQQQQNDDQVSILSAPGVLPSPASSVTSMIPTDDDACSAFVTPSPSSSTSSYQSVFSVKNHDQPNQCRITENEEQHRILPPSPTLTAYDTFSPQSKNNTKKSTPRNIPTIPRLPSLENNSYFSCDRPLPTQRRTPGRHRHSTIETNTKASRDSTTLNDRHSIALEQLAHDTLTYFVDTSTPKRTNHELCDDDNKNDDDPKAKLVEKLKSRLTSTSTSIHPSVLKLAQDVVAYMNETPPLTNEFQQLKPKLEVCLLIHANPNELVN